MELRRATNGDLIVVPAKALAHLTEDLESWTVDETGAGRCSRDDAARAYMRSIESSKLPSGKMGWTRRMLMVMEALEIWERGAERPSPDIYDAFTEARDMEAVGRLLPDGGLAIALCGDRSRYHSHAPEAVWLGDVVILTSQQAAALFDVVTGWVETGDKTAWPVWHVLDHWERGEKVEPPSLAETLSSIFD